MSVFVGIFIAGAIFGAAAVPIFIAVEVAIDEDRLRLSTLARQVELLRQ